MPEFRDARQSDVPSSIESDLCIIGGGAAGITLALTLGKQHGRIVLLESGGLTIDARTQSLYADLQGGLPYLPLAGCRLRYFGGTTNHWGGYCRPNEPLDFLGRPELGLPAWPLDATEIWEYLRAAHTQLGLDGEPTLDAASVARRFGIDSREFVEHRSAALRTPVSRLVVQRRLGEIHRQALVDRPDLQVYLYANATHLQVTDSGNRLQHVDVRTLGGRSLRVTARRFVLCCHAIENSRLLLASNDKLTAGIGNASDHVGGLFFPARPLPLAYDTAAMIKRNLNFDIGLAQAETRRLKVLQYFCRLLPLYSTDTVRQALARVSDGFWRPADARMIASLGVVARDLPEAVRLTLEKLRIARPDSLAYLIEHRIEQAPNAASRVTLADERDELGNRRARLNWQIDERDVRTYATGQQVLIRELSALGLGRFQAPELTADFVSQHIEGRNHHMGTTRMANSPADGVVDGQGKVHGIENLYVGGSSVFPTSGDGSPTMLLIALARRMAKHLDATANAVRSPA
jgi:choline dehydrogenase-like flavoprotein